MGCDQKVRVHVDRCKLLTLLFNFPRKLGLKRLVIVFLGTIWPVDMESYLQISCSGRCTVVLRLKNRAAHSCAAVHKTQQRCYWQDRCVWVKHFVVYYRGLYTHTATHSHTHTSYTHTRIPAGVDEGACSIQIISRPHLSIVSIHPMRGCCCRFELCVMWVMTHSHVTLWHNS